MTVLSIPCRKVEISLGDSGRKYTLYVFSSRESGLQKEGVPYYRCTTMDEEGYIPPRFLGGKVLGRHRSSSAPKRE